MTSRIAQSRKPSSFEPVLAALALEAPQRVLVDGRQSIAVRTVADREQPTLAEHDVDFVVSSSSSTKTQSCTATWKWSRVALELGALVRVHEVLGGEVVDPELLGEERRSPPSSGSSQSIHRRQACSVRVRAQVGRRPRSRPPCRGSRKHHALTVMRREPTQHRVLGSVSPMVFRDRVDAGRQLADGSSRFRSSGRWCSRSARWRSRRCRGRRVLGAPLDVILVRKLGVPGAPRARDGCDRRRRRARRQRGVVRASAASSREQLARSKRDGARRARTAGRAAIGRSSRAIDARRARRADLSTTASRPDRPRAPRSRSRAAPWRTPGSARGTGRAARRRCGSCTPVADDVVAVERRRACSRSVRGTATSRRRPTRKSYGSSPVNAIPRSAREWRTWSAANSSAHAVGLGQPSHDRGSKPVHPIRARRASTGRTRRTRSSPSRGLAPARGALLRNADTAREDRGADAHSEGRSPAATASCRRSACPERTQWALGQQPEVPGSGRAIGLTGGMGLAGGGPPAVAKRPKSVVANIVPSGGAVHADAGAVDPGREMFCAVAARAHPRDVQHAGGDAAASPG